MSATTSSAIRRAAGREGLQQLDRGPEDGEAENHTPDSALRTRGAEQAEHGIGDHVLHFVTDRRRRQCRRSARGKGRRPARPRHRTRSATGDGPPGARNAKVLLEKEKTAPRPCSPNKMTTTESTYDVKEKRRYSLTSVTTVGRSNNSAGRSSVADVTRLPLRSHKGGCYSPANPKGRSRACEIARVCLLTSQLTRCRSGLRAPTSGNKRKMKS